MGEITLRDWLNCSLHTTKERCRKCHEGNFHHCPACKLCVTPEQLQTLKEKVMLEEL